MNSQFVMSLLVGPISAAIVTAIGAVWIARQNQKAKKSLETLKTDLAFSLVRQTKFAEKELEVLAECWAKIEKLYLYVLREEHNLVRMCRITFVENGKLNELSQFTEAQCKECISTSVYKKTINAENIAYIASQSNEKRARLVIYYNYQYYVNIYKKKYEDFAVYFATRKIFISPHIKTFFQAVSIIFYNIDSELEKLAFKLYHFEIEDKEIVNYIEIADKQVSVLFEETNKNLNKLEKLITAKLFPEERESAEKEHNLG